MVPVEGIEPPLLAEHDFESCASTSSATRARRMIRNSMSRDGGRFSDNIMRQEAPLYIRALAASMRRPCLERPSGDIPHCLCIGAPNRQIAAINRDGASRMDGGQVK